MLCTEMRMCICFCLFNYINITRLRNESQKCETITTTPHTHTDSTHSGAHPSKLRADTICWWWWRRWCYCLLNLTAYNLLLPFLNAVSEHVSHHPVRVCVYVYVYVRFNCYADARNIRECPRCDCIGVKQSQICCANYVNNDDGGASEKDVGSTARKIHQLMRYDFLTNNLCLSNVFSISSPDEIRLSLF